MQQSLSEDTWRAKDDRLADSSGFTIQLLKKKIEQLRYQLKKRESLEGEHPLSMESKVVTVLAAQHKQSGSCIIIFISKHFAL